MDDANPGDRGGAGVTQKVSGLSTRQVMSILGTERAAVTYLHLSTRWNHTNHGEEEAGVTQRIAGPHVSALQ